MDTRIPSTIVILEEVVYGYLASGRMTRLGGAVAVCTSNSTQ